MTSTATAPRLDVREFREQLGQAIESDLSVQGGAGFSAAMRGLRREGIFLGRMKASPHHARAGRGLHAAGEAQFVINYQIRGVGRVTQDGRASTINPGQFFVFTPGRPYEMHFDSTCDRIGMVVPAGRLPQLEHVLNSLTATAIGEHAVTRAMARVLLGLEAELSAVPGELQGRMLEHAVDSVETLTRFALGSAALRKASLLERALDFIAEHLQDPALSPASIAAGLFVSERALYAGFDSAPLSPAASIRHHRLLACRRDLADSRCAEQPIAAIGARWGFATPSHFTAAFRTAFGQTPSEFRRNARQPGRA